MKVRLILTPEYFVLIPARGKPVRLSVSGPRQNHWANAILMLPQLVRKLGELGVSAIHLPGSADPTRVSAAHFALLEAKGDAELEEARQEALQIAQQAGISITSDDVVLRSVDEVSFGDAGNETDTGAFA